jgi:hypothetical protein
MKYLQHQALSNEFSRYETKQKERMAEMLLPVKTMENWLMFHNFFLQNSPLLDSKS